MQVSEEKGEEPECSCRGQMLWEDETCPRHGTAAVVRARAELRGAEVDKDVGIASQHRARLGARISGNVASGLVQNHDWAELDEEASTDAMQLVADDASAIAEKIMRRWGL